MKALLNLLPSEYLHRVFFNLKVPLKDVIELDINNFNNQCSNAILII